MGSREGGRERGKARGARLVQDLTREWRNLRLAAGLSQRAVARAIGISREMYGMLERAQVNDIGVARSAEITAVLGGDLSVKVPEGASVETYAFEPAGDD